MAWGLVVDIERRGEKRNLNSLFFSQRYIPFLNFTQSNSSFVSFPSFSNFEYHSPGKV